MCRYVEDGFAAFAAYKNAFSLKNPREIADTQNLPKPVLANMANYLDEPAEQPDPEKLALMRQYLLAD